MGDIVRPPPEEDPRWSSLGRSASGAAAASFSEVEDAGSAFTPERPGIGSQGLGAVRDTSVSVSAVPLCRISGVEKGEDPRSFSEVCGAAFSAPPAPRTIALSALLGSWIPLPLPPPYPSVTLNSVSRIGAGSRLTQPGVWTRGESCAPAPTAPPLVQVVGVSGFRTDGSCGNSRGASSSPPLSPMCDVAFSSSEGPSGEAGGESAARWEVVLLREEKAASPRESFSAVPTLHGFTKSDSHSLCCAFSSSGGGAEGLASVLGLGGSLHVLAAAIHDCSLLGCSDRKAHAALRRCVFLIKIPCLLSGTSCSASALRAYLSGATASLDRKFSIVKCKTKVSRTASCGGDSAGGSLLDSRISAEEELAALLGWRMRSPLPSASCVRLKGLSASAKGPGLDWLAPVSRASSGSLGNCNSGNCCISSFRLSALGHSQLMGLHHSTFNNAGQSLDRRSSGAECKDAADVSPFFASSLPLLLANDRTPSSACISCGTGGEGALCLCAVKSLLGGKRSCVASSPEASSSSCNHTTFADPSFLVLCGVRLVSVCTHLETVSFCSFLGPTAVAPLLLLAETTRGSVFIWRCEGDCLFQLSGRLGLDATKLAFPQRRFDISAESQVASVLPRRSLSSSLSIATTGSLTPRGAGPSFLAHRFALLEVDERALQIPRVCFGLDDSSPLGAVPRLHVLFAYRSVSHGHQRRRSRETSDFFINAFMIDALARGSVGQPVIQQVAGSAQLPFGRFGVEEILEVSLAEVNLWSDSIFVDVASDGEDIFVDDLLASGALLGEPVFSGASFCGCISARHRLEAKRPQSCFVSEDASSQGAYSPPLFCGNGSSNSAADVQFGGLRVSGQPAELQWGELSGFLASVIPPCRLRVLTGKGEELLLLLAPAILRLRGCAVGKYAFAGDTSDAAGASQLPPSSQLEVRYSIRCLFSSSLLLELPALGSVWASAGTESCNSCATLRTERETRKEEGPCVSPSTQLAVEDARRSSSLSVLRTCNKDLEGELSGLTSTALALTARESGSGCRASDLGIVSLASLSPLGLDAVCLRDCGVVLLWRNRGLHGGEAPLCSLQSAPLLNAQDEEWPSNSYRQSLPQRRVCSRSSRGRLSKVPPVVWIAWLPTTLMEHLEGFAETASSSSSSTEAGSDEDSVAEEARSASESLTSPYGRLPLLLCMTADRRSFFLVAVDLNISLLGVQQISLSLAAPLAPTLARKGVSAEWLEEMFHCVPSQEESSPPRSQGSVLAAFMVELPSPLLSDVSRCAVWALLIVVMESPTCCHSSFVSDAATANASDRRCSREQVEPRRWLMVFGFESERKSEQVEEEREEADAPSVRIRLLGAWKAEETKLFKGSDESGLPEQSLHCCCSLNGHRLLVATPLRLFCDDDDCSEFLKKSVENKETHSASTCAVYVLTLRRGGIEKPSAKVSSSTLYRLGLATFPESDSQCVACAVAPEVLATLALCKDGIKACVFSLLGLPRVLHSRLDPRDERWLSLPLETVVAEEKLPPPSSSSQGAETDGGSSAVCAAGEISFCRLADARLALLVKTRRASRHGDPFRSLQTLSVYVQRRRGVQNAVDECGSVELNSASWPCSFRFERPVWSESEAGLGDGVEGEAASCEVLRPALLPTGSGDSPCISDGWWSDDGALLLLNSNEGTTCFSSCERAEAGDSLGQEGGGPRLGSDCAFCRVPGAFFLAAEGSLPAATANGCLLRLPATETGLAMEALTRAKAVERKLQQQILRCATSANAATVNAALSRVRSTQLSSDGRVATDFDNWIPHLSSNLSSSDCLARQKASALKTATGAIVGDASALSRGGVVSANVADEKKGKSIVEAETLDFPFFSSAAAARSYGRCPLYKPATLLQFLRLGNVGTVKWILKILLKCLLVSGVRTGKDVVGQAQVPQGLDEEGGLCHLCGGRVVGSGGDGETANVEGKGREEEAFCLGLVCERQRSCELTGLLHVCMASAAFALLDLFAQQQADDVLWQHKSFLEASSQADSGVEAQRAMLKAVERRQEALSVSAYLAFASRCLPPRFRPSAEAVREALRERHLLETSGNGNSDAALRHGNEEGGILRGDFMRPSTSVLDLATGERRAGAASCLFGSLNSRDEDDDPFDVQSILGLKRETAEAKAEELGNPQRQDRNCFAAEASEAFDACATTHQGLVSLTEQTSEEDDFCKVTAESDDSRVLEALRATVSVDVSLSENDFALLLCFLEVPVPGLDLTTSERVVLRALVSSLQKLEAQTPASPTQATSTLESDFPSVAAKVEAAAKAVAASTDALSGCQNRLHIGKALVRDVREERALPLVSSQTSPQQTLPTSKREVAAAAAAKAVGAAVATAFAQASLRRLGLQRSNLRFALALWRLRELELNVTTVSKKLSSNNEVKEPPLRDPLSRDEKNLTPADSALHARMTALPVEGLLTSEELCWAIQSNAEEEFLELVLQHCRAAHPDGRLSWSLLRLRGIGFWLRRPSFVRRLTDELLTDAMRATAVETQSSSSANHAEQTSRWQKQGQFASSSQSASSGSLPSSADWVVLWAAVSGKKTIMQAIFKAQGNTRVVEFLANDFAEERWRAAAEKNAFKLLGQRRAHLALAFLCLGCRFTEAADVCCRVVKDTQLALVLLRSISAWTCPEAPTLGLGATDVGGDTRDREALSRKTTLEVECCRVLLDSLLPQAKASGDVWLSFCCLWLAGHHARAFATLVPPYLSDEGISRTLRVSEEDGREEACGLRGETGSSSRLSAQLSLRADDIQDSSFKKLENKMQAFSSGEEVRSAASASVGGLFRASSLSVFEDGRLKHSVPSLAISEFRAVVSQMLPMRRLAAGLLSEEGQASALHFRTTSQASLGSLSECGSEVTSTSGQRDKWAKASASGSLLDEVGRIERASLPEDDENMLVQRRINWAIRRPAEAVEADFYWLTCFHIRQQDPFMAAAAVTSLLAVQKNRHCWSEAFSDAEEERDPAAFAAATKTVPHTQLPTVSAALRLFAAGCALPLLLSSLVAPQRLWANDADREIILGSFSVAPLLGLSRGLLLFLTDPDFDLLLDERDFNSGRAEAGDNDISFRESPSVERGSFRYSHSSQKPQTRDQLSPPSLPEDWLFPSLRTNTPWFLLASLERSLEKSGGGVQPMRPLFKEALQRSRTQLFLSPFGAADATVASRGSFLRRASSCVFECLEFAYSGSGCFGAAGSESSSVEKTGSLSRRFVASGESLSETLNASLGSLHQPFSGVVAALSWRLASVAERLLAGESWLALGVGGVPSRKGLLRIRCPPIVQSALCDLALLSSRLPRNVGLSGSEGALLLHAATGASPFASSQPSVSCGGFSACSALPQGSTQPPVCPLASNKQNFFEPPDHAGEDAANEAAHFVSLSFAQMLGAAEAAEEAADAPLVLGRKVKSTFQKPHSEKGSLTEAAFRSCLPGQISGASNEASRRSSCSSQPETERDKGGKVLSEAAPPPGVGQRGSVESLIAGGEEDRFGTPLLLPLLQSLVQELLEAPAIHPKSLGLPALYCCLCACLSSLFFQRGQHKCGDRNGGRDDGSLQDCLPTRRLFASVLCGSAGLLLAVVGCFPAVFAVEGSPLLQTRPTTSASEAAAHRASPNAASCDLASNGGGLSHSEPPRPQASCSCCEGRDPLMAALEVTLALRSVTTSSSSSLRPSRHVHLRLLRALQTLVQPRECCAMCLRNEEFSQRRTSQPSACFEAFIWKPGNGVRSESPLVACVASCVCVCLFEVMVEALRLLGAELLSACILLREKLLRLHQMERTLAQVEEAEERWKPRSLNTLNEESQAPSRPHGNDALRLAERRSLRNVRAAVQRLVTRLSEVKNLKAAAEQFTSTVTEYLCAQLRPAFFRAVAAAAPLWLAFFKDCTTTSSSRENLSAITRWMADVGGAGLPVLWEALGSGFRLRWALQRTSFLPVPPLISSQSQSLKAREVDGGVTRPDGPCLEAGSGDWASKQLPTGRHFSHGLHSQEPSVSKSEQSAHSVFQGENSKGSSSGEGIQRNSPTVTTALLRGRLHPRPASAFAESNYYFYTRHPHPLRAESNSCSAVLRQVESFLVASELPAVSCAFAGSLDASPCSLCCRQSSSNCFEATRTSERLLVETLNGGEGGGTPLTSAWFPHHGKKRKGCMVDSVPLAALFGPTAVSCCSCATRRYFQPVGLARSGEVAFGVTSMAEGGMFGLRTMQVPRSLLCLLPDCFDTSSSPFRDGTEGTASGSGLFIGLSAASCRLNSRLLSASCAGEASVSGSASWELQLQTAERWGSYLEHLIRRDTAAYGVVQVARMSCPARLLAWLAGSATALEANSSAANSTSGGASSGRVSSALESVDDSGSASPSSARLPLYPYSVFPSLSALRSVFDFTGTVAAHPFLPVFTALLRAPALQGDLGAETASHVFMAALRPFGPCARSLPRSAATRRLQVFRGEESTSEQPNPACPSSNGLAEMRLHSKNDAANLTEVEKAPGETDSADANAGHSLSERRRKSGAPPQQFESEEHRTREKAKKELANKGSISSQMTAAAVGTTFAVSDRPSRKTGPSTQISLRQGPVLAAVWTLQGDALAVADATNGIGIYWMQRGPLLPPAAAGEALGAANSMASSLTSAQSSLEARATRQALLSRVPLQLRRVCNPALYWRPHLAQLKEILFADSCGGWLLTLGVGVPQTSLVERPVLIPGTPSPKLPFSRSAFNGIEAASPEEATSRMQKFANSSAVFAGQTPQQQRTSSWAFRSPHLQNVSNIKCRRRAAMFRLLANARSNGHSLISRFLSARAAGARLLSGRASMASLGTPRNAECSVPFGSSVSSAVSRSRWKTRGLLFPSKCYRHTAVPTAEGRSRSRKAVDSPRKEDAPLDLPPSTGKEDSWLFQDANSWASGLLNLSTFVGVVDTAQPEESDSSQDTWIPVVSDACICVWRLADVSPSGCPRLEAVVTCDDLLGARLNKEGCGAASKARHSAVKERNARTTEATDGSGGGSASLSRFWSVEATHEPTCMCLAVFQEGTFSCPCCTEAAGGCNGSCCVASLSSTCCGGNCGALRCVVYGDGNGKVHAVELGLQEEVLRWQAHDEGQSVLQCVVGRASSGISAAPEVWLATSARHLSEAGDLVVRCWSVVGLGEGGPVLLHQVSASALLVSPLGRFTGSSSSSQAKCADFPHALSKANKTSGTVVATPGAALARLLGTNRKGHEGGPDISRQVDSNLLYLGGRTFLSVEAGGVALLIHV